MLKAAAPPTIRYGLYPILVRQASLSPPKQQATTVVSEARAVLAGSYGQAGCHARSRGSSVPAAG